MQSRRKRAAAVAVDAVLGALALPLLRRRRAGTLPKHPRVLVVRCDHIGDAAIAAALLPALRESLGASRLDVLAAPWTAELFRASPAVDEVIAYAAPWWVAARGGGRAERRSGWRALPGLIKRLRSRRYDVGIDLRGDLRHIAFFLALGGCGERVSTDRTGGRSLLTRCWPFDRSLHETEKNAAIAGLLGVAVAPPARLAPPTLAADLDSVLAEVAGRDGFVALAVRGNKPNRSWPTSRAAEFVRLVGPRLGLGVVCVGGPGDRDVADAICAGAGSTRAVNLAGAASLTQSLAVLARARALVTVDTGPMHLAGLVDTPVLALFGAGDPRQFGPWSSSSRVVSSAPCACPFNLCERPVDGAAACMSRITGHAVVGALAALLAGEAPEPWSSAAATVGVDEG